MNLNKLAFDSDFSGRVLQITEALDFGDAVSNQIIAMDSIFQSLGLESIIYSRWHHEKVAHLRAPSTDLKPTDKDVLIIHFCGYSEMMSQFHSVRCVKIMAYHNITPKEFFEPGSDLHDFCMKGRLQLCEVIESFDYFWGDSAYNLEDLILQGASKEKCHVIPIIVEPKEHKQDNKSVPIGGAWLFLGRVASNKGQLELTRMFAQIHHTDKEIAKHLYLVGSFNPADSYYQAVIEEIRSLGLESSVTVTGKVEDFEVIEYFQRSSIYVSLSKHEGFGVPLIEAAFYGLPVIAINDTAVGETLGIGALEIRSYHALQSEILKISRDKTIRDDLIHRQKQNAERFRKPVVTARITNALKDVLPSLQQFNRVSVIICTYNRADLLDRCLDYLRYQTNHNFEVIVVNGPSSDCTQAVLDKYSGQIKIGINLTRNLAVSRNIGIELAGGEIIAFIDDDALPFDDWIHTIISEFQTRPLKMGALGGPVYYAGTLDFQSQDIGINKFAEAKVNIDSELVGSYGWERSLLGTNTCFSASALRAVSGFDEQFDYFLDESELCYRLAFNGFLVCYCPELYLRHEFAQSHNRRGKHSYNWFTICKNTSYYIAAYSGLSGGALEAYVRKRMEEERIAPIIAARDLDEISNAECATYIDAINAGATQGLKDAKDFPKRRMLYNAAGHFRTFTCKANYPLVGLDVNRLHICIVSKEFPPFAGSGGIGTLYYHLASELLLMGHFVSVIAPASHGPVYKRGRFQFIPTPVQSVASDILDAPGFSNNINWAASALKEVSKLHVSHNIDIIESALWDSEALLIALLPKLNRPALMLRLVTPFSVAARLNHWSVPARESELYVAAERELIRGADAIVAISESIAATIEEEHMLVRDERWSVSHCGVAYWSSFDVSTGYSELSAINGKPLALSENARIVLFVGRLEGRKGVETLLVAARSFLANSVDAYLVFAGRDVENWEARAKNMLEFSLSSRCVFLGLVDDQSREKLLKAACLVVFPSRYESFGLVPLEAFVHGTPVVASRVGAIPEVIEHGVCGLLFEDGNASELSNCVSAVLDDPQLQLTLSSGARARSKLFSSRSCAIRAVKLYSLVLAKRRLAKYAS